MNALLRAPVVTATSLAKTLRIPPQARLAYCGASPRRALRGRRPTVRRGGLMFSKAKFS
jgi:hypothetical protein